MVQDGVEILESIAFPINVEDRQQMLNIVNSCIGTKFTTRFGSLMSELALDAVKAVTIDMGDGKKDIDIKKYAKVEKIPGGDIEVRAPAGSFASRRNAEVDECGEGDHTALRRAWETHTVDFLRAGAEYQ
jgi:chaperonin GroEL (HSP60 family)